MSVTWGGSLVGSNNPEGTGYDVAKRRKLNDSTNPADFGLPSSVVVKFRPVKNDGDDSSDSSNTDWPQLDLPIGTTITELEALVHNLLEKNEDEHCPYAFYVGNNKVDKEVDKEEAHLSEDIEVVKSLFDTIKQHSLSTESTLNLSYLPLSLFRVKPVTRCTDTMPGHTDAILHVSYSPCGRFLASGGGDATVRFWDVHTCLPRKTCQGHRDHVLVTGWSPDGKKFASGDKKGVMIIWDPDTGESKKQIKAHSKWITAIAWEPMHRNVNCERIITSSKDMLVKIWNVRLGSVQATLSGHTDSVECVKWGGEGLVYTASRDRTIKVWGADPDPSATSSNKDVGKLVRTLTGHGHRVNTLALNCEYACRTGCFDHNGYKQFKDDAAALESAVSRYEEIKKVIGEEVLVSGSDDFTLFFWKPTESKHAIKRLTGHQQAVNDIKFSPDGRYFASGSFDKKIKIWDGRNGNFVTTLTGHVGAVYCVSWSSDSRYLVSGSKDSTVKLWSVSDPKRAKETLSGHADEIYALDWAPNGVSLASGSKDRLIKVWKH